MILLPACYISYNAVCFLSSSLCRFIGTTCYDEINRRKEFTKPLLEWVNHLIKYVYVVRYIIHLTNRMFVY